MESITSGQIGLIIGLVSLVGVAFTVYKSYRNPQVELDKRTAVDKEKVDGKAEVLAQQMNWEKEANAQRFKDMSDNLDKATTLAQNHIHTVSTQVESLDTRVSELKVEVVKIGTLLEERLPRITK